VRSLMLLLASAVVPLIRPQLTTLSSLIIIIGLTTSMLGIYDVNR
jgi:hypothetical protein